MSPTIIIGILLATVIGIKLFFVDSRNYRKRNYLKLFPYSIYGAIVGFFVGGLIWSFIGILWQTPLVKVESQEQREIVSLKDGQGVSGSFFLGCGAFSSGMKYYAFEDLGSKSFRMAYFNPSRDIVIEDIKKGEQPYFVEIYNTIDKNSTKWEWRKWLAGPNEDKHNFILWEIHIPLGTILKDSYKLDLE